jgi:hypothetical protein
MLSNVTEELNKFAKYVVSQSRANLTRSKKNASKQLYNSIEYKVKESKNSFQLEFLMEDYGIFQDKGVKGKDPSKVSPNARITGQQAPNSPYKFGSGKTGNWKQFVASIEKWAKKRNVRFRDEKGRFKKGSYKSLAYVIAGNIYNRGIKPSMFFTKPFEKAFKNLDEDLVNAFRLDMEKLLTTTTKDNLKK